MPKPATEKRIKAAQVQAAPRAEPKAAPATGSGLNATAYKGYVFADNHRRIRDRSGKQLDTAQVLAAAAAGNADACALLDWYIETGYAYLKKVAPAKAVQPENED